MPTGPGIRTFVLTLNGSVQNLATLAGFTKGGDVDAEPAFRELHFESLVGNANEIYIGQAGSTVSATNYGFRLQIPATAFREVVLGPYSTISPLKLSSLEVIGTNTQKLVILGVI